jgi:hypothetical protein
LRAVIFSGPTLWSDPILRARDFLFLPPAKDGDVYRAARSDAPAIGIIDGQFETAPGIWHKEILFALSRGIPVFGAASMGALRAAELAPFGMVGVGRIFESISSGALRDDDEVAVLHTGAELRFRPLSEAMVDMRATLAVAQDRAVISSRTAEQLSRRAKATFFKERTWPRVLKAASTTPLRKRELAAFSQWLPANKVEQKREDARAMLAAMRALIASGTRPFRPAFEFQRTCFWRSFVATQRRARA